MERREKSSPRELPKLENSNNDNISVFVRATHIHQVNAVR